MKHGETPWKAEYRPNLQYEIQQAPSTLLHELIVKEWLPDQSGKYYKPADITFERLHPQFTIDGDRSFIDQLEIGKNDQEANDRREKKAQFERMGLSPEVVEQMLNDPEGVNERLKSKKKLLFPSTSVPNKRRRDKVREKASDQPPRKIEIRPRNVNLDKASTKKESKTYLRGLYNDNENDVFYCQGFCVDGVMPFKLKGKFYFEAVTFLDLKEKDHFQNAIALCPNCSAQYQNGRKDETNENLNLIRGIEVGGSGYAEIPIKIDKKEVNFKITNKHLVDLQSIIESDDD